MYGVPSGMVLRSNRSLASIVYIFYGFIYFSGGDIDYAAKANWFRGFKC